MGEVYLAEDTVLRRKVALKILSAELIKNENRLRRFEQEAYSASSLSHPNILVIHEIGAEGDTHFIATEFIEGDTLRHRIGHGKFNLRDVLEAAIQAASALSAAHKAGIVHRDIKPENIMLREDGYVKVLDFGLAKLTERRAPPSADTEAQTIARVDTDPGTVVGTVNYMSPEQARGKSVDTRTDVFSLGAVIYEMVAGRPAFEGESSTDVLAAILDKDPPPLARFAPETPAELQRIVSKSLSKDREERYQTIKDLIIDLKNLREELTFEEKLERSVSPEGGRMALATSSGGATVTSTQASTTQGSDPIAARTTSSAEVILSQIKRHKTGVAAASVMLVLFAAGAGYIVYKLLNKGSTARPFQSFKITRLTNTGRASDAVISPDGRYVVHVVDDFGQQSLWVRQVNTASNVQIVPAAEVSYLGMTFSRDGDYVYYVTREGNSPQGNLFQIPVLGGTPRKLIEDIDTPPGFSPDQKRLAFIRNMGVSESHVILANADGAGEQILATLKTPSGFLYNQARGPAWSPDGKVIVCPIERTDASGSYNTLAVVDVSNGALRPFNESKWDSIRRVTWLANGSGLLMVAGDTPANSAAQQVYYVSYPDGSVHQLTNDLNNYYGLSLKADSSAFVTVQRVTFGNIWVVSAADTTTATQVTFGASRVDGTAGLAFAPDGRIVYVSNSGGSPDLWIMRNDGAEQKQLIANGRLPAVSPDGHHVAFISSRAGTNSVWRMNLDGGNLKQVSSEIVTDPPDFSSDSRWIFIGPYNSYGIVKVPVDDGESVQLNAEGQIVYAPQVSPDGKLLATIYRETVLARYQLGIMPFEGGKVLKVFDLARTVRRNIFRWAPDGRAIHYIDTRGGVSNIWSQSVDGGPPKQLTNFKSDLIFWFDWSRDGKQLALSRGTVNSDVVLINESR